jgi:hypothetical protein
MARRSSAKKVKRSPITVDSPRKTITMTGAVKAAIAAGVESPTAGVAFIKSQYGIDMPRNRFSIYKSRIRKRAGSPKPAAAAAAPSKVMKKPLPAKRFVVDSDVLLALEAIKPLIEQHGADKVRRIVDLLS